MNRNDIQALYISPLSRMFSDNIRLIEENGEISDIMLDGEKEEFFLSFIYAGRVDLCWNNELFIFDRGRDLLTLEDTFGEIVYENSNLLSDCNKQANLIIQIVAVLNGSTFLGKKEIETDKKTPSGYDRKRDYIINIAKADSECKKWVFDNIEIRCT